MADRFEINHEGKIVAAETELCADKEQIVIELFSQYGWSCKQTDKEGSCQTLELTDPNGNTQVLNVYTANLRNESRSPFEKKGQTNLLDNPSKRDKKNTIILGIYVYKENDTAKDAIFVGFPVAERGTNSSMRGVQINKLLVEAKTKGFVYNKEHNNVGFRSEFVFYYLQNYYALHYEGKRNGTEAIIELDEDVCFDENIYPEEVVLTESTIISEEDFRVWLSKQAKKDGNLISNEHQNACYYVLKAVPSMLGFASVFSITDPVAFGKYRREIEKTVQYQEANPNVGAGALSAALTKYGKYLEERHGMSIPADRLAQILKDWYEKKYVENNITSTLVGFGFKYARAINNAKVTAKALLDLAGIESTMAAYIDRGKDLAAGVEKDSFGITMLPKKTCTGELRYTTNLESKYSPNRIIFGAPGTGKSFTLNNEKEELLSNGGEFERVTFHPDYSYANFVGAYKPVPCKDKSGNDAITYDFVPGPFMRTYVKALHNSRTNDPKPFLLVIEEINRANVAGVFGDVFQLLDRGADNVSEYAIQASEDIKKYLAKALDGEEGNPEDYAEIRIPDNMFIWATMNSADQGVFPMDTAFKRRWDFTYMGIDHGAEKISGKKVVLGKGEHKRLVEWNTLREAINEELVNFKINEDKLMGPFFLSKKVIPEVGEIDQETFIAAFKNKVIMYLFDDAAKQKRPTLFSGCEDKSKNQYSKICAEFEEKGVFIFCEAISSRFIDVPKDDDE